MKWFSSCICKQSHKSLSLYTCSCNATIWDFLKHNSTFDLDIRILLLYWLYIYLFIPLMALFLHIHRPLLLTAIHHKNQNMQSTISFKKKLIVELIRKCNRKLLALEVFKFMFGGGCDDNWESKLHYFLTPLQKKETNQQTKRLQN